MTRRIVVGVDDSDASRAALRWAETEAGLRDIPLELVHAWHYPTMSRVGELEGLGLAWAELEGAERDLVARVVDAMGDVGVDVATLLVRGNPSIALLAAARGADLLVVGSRGRGGFASLLLGSVSQQCAEHATVPVVVVPRSAPRPRTGCVVVGVDGSPSSDAALRWAADEARSRDAILELVHGWQFPAIAYFPDMARAGLTTLDIQRLAEEVLEAAVERCDLCDGTIVVKRTVSNDIPAPALLHASEHADLLVVGSRGQGGFAGLLLGSVSQTCLHRTPVPIVIVHE